MLEALIFVVFPFCMAFAAVSDMLSMTIAKRVSVLLVAVFAIVAPLTGMDWARGLHRPQHVPALFRRWRSGHALPRGSWVWRAAHLPEFAIDGMGIGASCSAVRLSGFI